MLKFSDSFVASPRRSQNPPSARSLERYRHCTVLAETEFRKRRTWNLGAVSQRGRECRQSALTTLAWVDVMEWTGRETESSDNETTESTELASHIWNTLTTTTTFDQGTSNDTESTLCLNKDINANQNNGTIVPQEQHVSQGTGVVIESLLEQLCTILEKDEARRNKLYYTVCDQLRKLNLINDTYNTREFEVLRGQYQRAFYRMFTVARDGLESENALSVSKFIVPKLFRYRDEFDEISFIARGGFGKVYKARHRLDGTEYAIKKITMSTDHIETGQQQLNEVWTLAKLKHTNIVSYNAAWIELSDISTSTDRRSDRRSGGSHGSKRHSEQPKSYNSLIDNLFNNKNGRKIRRSKVYRNTGDSVINRKTISKRFEEVNSPVNIVEEIIVGKSDIDKNIVKSKIKEYTDESSSSVVSFRNSNNNDNPDEIMDTGTDSSSSYSCEESTSRDVCAYTPENNRPSVILYIQMSLCDQTLEQWMRGKISVTPEPMARAIFQQILCGVDYMHSQKVVHHDIKPSNIFITLNGELRIQLGDFGLACPLQKEKHNSVIGTRLYAAPEQLEGKCNTKSDIYSIGIILIQLLTLIKTEMELCSVISSLKNGIVPEVLMHHKWAQMIKQLVQKDPSERPSTSQLLKDFSDDKDMIINQLQDTIMSLENVKCIQKSTIEKLQEENALLKEQIQKLTDNTTN